MKNVAILTLGLRHNYGGILQAAALYNFLKREGYNPVLLRKYQIQKGWKAIIIKALEILPFQNLKGFRNSYIKYINNIQFFNEYMPSQTKIMTYKSQIEEFLNKYEIDAIVVGSDQVWRYTYINDSEYDIYFLNFKLNREIKKISYAASFGIDTWEAPSENLNIKKYLSDFNAVSVRESSGQEICKKDFGKYDVELVLDPTLLIDQSFYLDMIKNKSPKNYDCITYILDENTEKKELVKKINVECQHKSVFNLLTKSSKLSVQDWVASFKSSDFIITDSFHGMVFSIIFNKQFVVLINKDRGSDRFFSLCHLLGLQDRLYDPTLGLTFDLKSIDYSDVNKKLESLRKSSKKYLLDALEE